MLYFNSRKNAWLSNFAPCVIELGGMEFATLEHAYQACKTLDKAQQAAIAACTSAVAAKRAGKTVTLRPGWEEKKVLVMQRLVEFKFRGPYQAELVGTGDVELVHYCPWGDRLWGVDRSGAGRNLLGKQIMEVRARLATS